MEVQIYANFTTFLAAYPQKYEFWRSKSSQISSLSWQRTLRNTNFRCRQVATFAHFPGSVRSGIRIVEVEEELNFRTVLAAYPQEYDIWRSPSRQICALSWQRTLRNTNFGDRKVVKFHHFPGSVRSGIRIFEVE